MFFFLRFIAQVVNTIYLHIQSNHNIMPLKICNMRIFFQLHLYLVVTALSTFVFTITTGSIYLLVYVYSPGDKEI